MAGAVNCRVTAGVPSNTLDPKGEGTLALFFDDGDIALLADPMQFVA
jgi:hypothetical protein